MVERKKPKEGSTKSSVKSSKDSSKAAVFVPPKKSESKIDGVGEYECSTIVSHTNEPSNFNLVSPRNANFHHLGWSLREVTNSNFTFQVRRSRLAVLCFLKR